MVCCVRDMWCDNFVEPIKTFWVIEPKPSTQKNLISLAFLLVFPLAFSYDSSAVTACGLDSIYCDWQIVNYLYSEVVSVRLLDSCRGSIICCSQKFSLPRRHEKSANIKSQRLNGFNGHNGDELSDRRRCWRRRLRSLVMLASQITRKVHIWLTFF